jgi:hypothetical protein
MNAARTEVFGNLATGYRHLTVVLDDADLPTLAPGWRWVFNARSEGYEVWCKGSGLYQGTPERMAARTWELWEKGSNLTRAWYERAVAAIGES